MIRPGLSPGPDPPEGMFARRAGGGLADVLRAIHGHVQPGSPVALSTIDHRACAGIATFAPRPLGHMTPHRGTGTGGAAVHGVPF
jgi:hypothetical protein